MENIVNFRSRLTRIARTELGEHAKRCAIAIGLAIDAAEKGNFGVGAIVVDAFGDIVASGQNRMFVPVFRSDLHAEMDALNNFERRAHAKTDFGEVSLYSSLEPCPMCLTRILFSGVSVVRYAASDPRGGMARTSDRLPPIFADWATQRDVAPASISDQLAQLALDVHESSAPNALLRLQERWTQVRE